MGRLSCGVQCSRTILLALNVLFMLFGCALMGLGVYMKVNKNFIAIITAHTSTEKFEGATMQALIVIMITVGVFTLLLSTFGCLGAVCKNRCLLYIYAVILSILIILELTAFVLVLAYRNRLWRSYNDDLLDIFRSGYSKNQTDVIAAIETLESTFKCCGVESFADYNQWGCRVGISTWGCKLPSSCYRSHMSGQGDFYREGCANTIAIWLWNELPIIAGVLAVVLLTEIFGVICAIALGVAINHSSTGICYELN